MATNAPSSTRAYKAWVNEQMKLWSNYFIPSEFAGPPERAILYGLEKGNGWVDRDALKEMIQQLSKRGRQRLKRQGVLFGPNALCHPLALAESQAKVAFWAATEANGARTQGPPPVIVERSKMAEGPSGMVGVFFSRTMGDTTRYFGAVLRQ